MTGNVTTVDASASCHDAVRLMVQRKIRHLPVVSSTGALCGIITDRDLRHRLFAPDVFPSIGAVRVEELLSTVRVSDVMSTPVASVDSGTDLREAARAMAEKKVGSLPVVERDRVVGIVTETDMLRHIVGADACCADVEAIVVSYP
jgi:acetoin utilization protein AcuB